MKNRIIALILVLAFLVQALPLQVFAEQQGGSTEPEQEEFPSSTYPDIEEDETPAVPVVIGELTERRDETEKHFRMNDGSFIAVDYGLPVHFSEDGGETWEDIDNTLVLTDASSETDAIAGMSGMAAQGSDAGSPVTDEAPVYTAQNGENAHSFAQTLGSGFLFSTEDAGHGLRMFLADPGTGSDASTAAIRNNGDRNNLTIAERFNRNAAAEITYPDARTEEETDSSAALGMTGRADADSDWTDSSAALGMTSTGAEAEAEAEAEEVPDLAEQVTPSKLRADVLYRDVFDGVDLSYTLYSWNIKETILVNRARDSYVFPFYMDLGDLNPVLTEDRSVELRDSMGEIVYLIPAPYMTDAAGAYSDAVSYSMSRTETGAWQLTVTADEDWINDETRAFPVSIDPTVIDKVSNTNQGIAVTYVEQGNPNLAHNGNQTTAIGYTTYDNIFEQRIYLGIDKLPSIPLGSEVVNAQIYIVQERFQANNPVIAQLHEVTEEKPSGTSNYNWIYSRCWSNKPQHSSIVEDYAKLSSSTTNDFATWDMTTLVKKWYTNNSATRAATILLGDIGSYSGDNPASIWFYGYGTSYGPLFVVSYRDMTGIEPYYTYQTMGVDRAGTAYVSDYTGALTTVTPLVSYASTINPFSLNLIYSSSYFRKSGAAEVDIPQKMGYGFHMGNGMKLNVMQKVEFVHLQNEATSDNTTEYLKYTDGDGTAHYFAKDLSKDPEGKYYYDEDGLGLKAKQSTSNNDYIHITDDQGNDMFFCNGFLTQIKDANQNRIQIWFAEDNGSEGTYWYPTGSGDRIDHIVQKNNGGSKITVATFSYDTVNGRANTLRSITDAAGMVYTFRYSGKRTSTIRRNAENAATQPVYIQFDYSSTEGSNRLVQLTDVKSGYSVMATYSGGRVATLKEHSSEESGLGVTISRVIGEKTVYTDWGNDRIYGTDDDISTVYLFDNVGRTVNAYTSDASGKVLGASNAAYSETTGTNKKNNRTTRTSSIGMAGMNLIRYGGFEKNDDNGWVYVIPDGITATVNRNSGDSMARTGNFALKTSVNNTSSGVIGATRSTEPLKSETTYTVSAYVNTSSAAAFNSDSEKGAYIKIIRPNGNTVLSERINYATNNAIDNGWVRVSLTFTAGTNSSYTVMVCSEGIKGPVYFDDVQVEENATFSGVNLLENGGGTVSGECWQTLSGGVPTFTTAELCPAATYYGRSMKINGNPNENRWVEQTVTVNLPGTQTYVFSGWAKADAVPGQPEAVSGDPVSGIKHTKQFGLRAILTYADNTQEYHYAPFNPDVTEWQYNSLTIVPKKTGTDVSTIRVLCVYEKNANAAYFGNLSLVREVAQVMDYNNDGQLISVNSTDHAEQQYIYDGDKNLQKVTIGQQNTPGYREYNYTYDGAHNVLTASDGAIKQTNTYTDDDHTTVNGNVYKTKLSKATGGENSKGIFSESTYANSGNLVATQKNARGKATAYQYLHNLNKMLGLPAKVTNPAGTVALTEYLDDGRVSLSKINNTVQISRAYGENDFLTRLSRVGYNGTTEFTQYYNFTYNSFGSTTSIKVGTQKLAHYTYGLRNGLLEGMTYGNGDSVSYTYDNLGRKTQTTTSSGDSYNFAYTGDGQLYEMQDTAGSLLYRYTYDTIGRLISSSMKANGTVKLQTQHQYDNQNRLVNQTFALPGRTYGEAFTYDTYNRLTQKALSHPGGTSIVHIGYDADLSRVKTVTTPAAVTVFGYSYYKEDDVTHASNVVSSMQVTPINEASQVDAFKLGYTYDDAGNISKIEQFDPPASQHPLSTVYYQYDAQNQLTCESSTAIGTWNYGYDTVGNIRTKTHSMNGSTDETWTYSYGDEIWADKLTGLSITKNNTSASGSYTYDNSGNPTSYFNPGDLTTWTMTWKNGRELATASNGTHSVSYDYDVNGLRTYKIVDGVRHDYIYASGLLLQESYSIQEGGVTDTYVLDFQYDQNGRPYVLNYTKNGTTYRYYYILNLQGDVLYLVSASTGVTYAAYTYDAWGKVLTSTGTMAGRNPLRYRGYYYDSESGFYYLQSRYYDPALGRFINADSYASTGQGFLGYNMFAYCGNNCVISNDSSGHYATFDPNFLIDEEEAVYHEPINGQGREPYASMGFGSSDLEHSGCGAIGVHNALILSGHQSDIRHWISFFQSKRFFRLLGVFPWEIDDALDSVGVCYESSSDPSIVEKCKNGGVVIVTYWVETVTTSVSPTPFSSPVSGSIPWIFGGAHTIAITYHNNYYWVYNAWNEATGVETYKSINNCTTGGAFIYGYYIAP